jgi:hypothetical protein
MLSLKTAAVPGSWRCPRSLTLIEASISAHLTEFRMKLVIEFS